MTVRFVLAALLCLVAKPSLATGPLDVVPGASYCFSLAECSDALASSHAIAASVFVGGSALLSSSTPFTVPLENCSVTLATEGQAATTVSGCDGSGAFNGTALPTDCQNAFDSTEINRALVGACPVGVNSIWDQIGETTHFGAPQKGVGGYTATLLLSAYNRNPAWSFNGHDQWLRTTDTVFMSNLIGSGRAPSFTVLMRLKPTQTRGGVILGATPSSCVLDSNNVCVNGNGYFLWSLLGTGQIAAANNDIQNIGTSTCMISVNNWHWTAFSFDGTNGAWAFYADQTACGSGTTAGVLFVNNDSYPVVLGSGRNGENSLYSFAGLIRLLITYKSVLTQTQIFAIMSTESP
jgi:hypothetical protein